MSHRVACQVACRAIAKARQSWAIGQSHREGGRHLERAIAVLRKVIEAKKARRK
jgi:hypothetical protein